MMRDDKDDDDDNEDNNNDDNGTLSVLFSVQAGVSAMRCDARDGGNE